MEPEAEVLPRSEVEELKIEAAPGRRRVLSGAKNSVQLAIRVTTPPQAAAQEEEVRRPLHVACVLDCSGSMQGQRLAYGKKAVLKLVKHLHPCDTLHFVTYDTSARVVFKNGDLSEIGKEVLREHINAVRVGGQTNLCAGLELAVSLLEESAGAVSGTGLPPMQRVFLFSDGLVNCGVTDPQQIQRKVATWAAAGITTGSFGIGADFDEPLMRGIASAGQGRYQFLGTAQDIPKLVSKSIHDLIDIYASEAVLDLRGCEHTVVSRVYGGGDDDGEAYGASTIPGLLRLGDIHSDNLRLVLVELEVAPPGGGAIDAPDSQFCAAEWVLTCQRRGAPVSLSGNVQLQATRDRADLGPLSPMVQIAFAMRQATDLEREVAEHLSRRERPKAREVKSRQLALLEDALAAGQNQGQDASAYDLSKELELLTAVLERARQVAIRLEDDQEDEELMARQCWQDRDDMSAASLCDLRERCNSSEASDPMDVANLQDFDDNLSLNSPRSNLSVLSPRSSSGSATPPASPQRTSTPPPPAGGGTARRPAGLLGRLRAIVS
eukprot:TRINITY_DN29242_c0_g1_i1.p1 TRINITY_DN29242_c0_g1~~TRINITY_DN29242_c0_g1_i1.p1  ORF type:complete len:550 (+),score=95.39 TRINITY_DN29242_c0_g1_i1:96-1745(+)